MPQTTIQAIGYAPAPHTVPQAVYANWIKGIATARLARGEMPSGKKWTPEKLGATIDHLYANSGIRQRTFIVPDVGRSYEEFTFYPRSSALHPDLGITERMEFLQTVAPSMATAALRNCLRATRGLIATDITHLIVVTNSVLVLPGLDLALVNSAGLRRSVRRQVLGFMGCFAGLTAVRAANNICKADPGAVVAVVCLEAASPHFQYEPTVNNFVTNCVFSDGAVAAILTSDESRIGPGPLALEASCMEVIEGTSDHIRGDVRTHGIQATLDPRLPESLRGAIRPAVDGLLRKCRLGQGDVSFWSVHPGGRRILESVQSGLELDHKAMATSFDTLAQYGNLSAGAILLVIKAQMERGIAPSAFGAALAFGPGLTFEGLLMRSTGTAYGHQEGRAA